MSKLIVKLLAARLEEHASTISGERLVVVAHGGEPLLYPDLDFFFDELRRVVKSCTVEFAIQTNGTLISARKLAILEKHSVRIGFSVDGSRATHDRSRITHTGKGTYDSVMDGFALAKTRVPHLVQSVLQVIDLSVPPEQMLDLLESYSVRRADLLFPDLNHDTIRSSTIEPGQLGEWLVQVFNVWITRRKSVHLRVFETVIRLLLNQTYGTDQLGLRAAGALMIETDGSYQVHDGLRTTYEGAGQMGMTLEEHSVRAVESMPFARMFRDKGATAAAECRICDLFPVCGGGSPIHRYSVENGFARPSVYCKDLMILITHIRDYLKTVGPDLKLSIP